VAQVWERVEIAVKIAQLCVGSVAKARKRIKLYRIMLRQMAHFYSSIAV
jgi:hypothetical protein